MRIGIVNGRPHAVEALQRAVALKPEHHVVWVARSGTEAIERCERTPPHLVLMDLLAPEVDGVEATRRIMARTPCAILIVTVNVGANASRVYEAIGHGAIDAVDTPTFGAFDADPHMSAASLLTKIDMVDRMLVNKDGRAVYDNAVRTPPCATALVAIGASAGGPSALATVLHGLPVDFPAGIVVIQHVDEQFAIGMADWLRQHSTLPVRIAAEGDRPTAGTVLLAGTSNHLVFKSRDRLGYTAEPRDYVYRPSVDVFFQSVACHWRGATVGVLLTGMGRDGALGLKAMRNNGCHTIAQDEATSAVYGMPKAAASLQAAADILPMERIADRLVQLLTEPRTAKAI